ncbi:hypothetical protein JAAARDRAFT_690002 [Jaapia argillacea MUCL 33604]|uniref:Uncharacterized protein n=1 Tax=Jaapia argillacea MUCL 33604 TaxID=933084 RepID=A0A067P2R2_9AGAM|nr:hypothetical protein JAAARDRAFT_690002 [Jaapia argillacea MUCL 33604]
MPTSTPSKSVSSGNKHTALTTMATPKWQKVLKDNANMLKKKKQVTRPIPKPPGRAGRTSGYNLQDVMGLTDNTDQYNRLRDEDKVFLTRQKIMNEVSYFQKYERGWPIKVMLASWLGNKSYRLKAAKVAERADTDEDTGIDEGSEDEGSEDETEVEDTDDEEVEHLVHQVKRRKTSHVDDNRGSSPKAQRGRPPKNRSSKVSNGKQGQKAVEKRARIDSGLNLQ